MGNTAVLVIVFVGLVVLGGVLVLTTAGSRDRSSAVGDPARGAGRRDREAAASAAGADASGQEEGGGLKTLTSTGRSVERAAAMRTAGDVEPSRSAPPAPRAPLDAEAYGVTRRQFFNRGIIGMFVLGTSGFGTMVVAFLWPSLSGGFGSKIRAGRLGEILADIAESKEPFYVPEGRFYIAPYPKDAVEEAKAVYSGAVLAGMENGVVALYQKCVHLGCRVPWCKTSQWFECPCHGSSYNRVGEKKAGPAPRGLDRFGVDVAGDVVTVDTQQVIQGPPIGVNTTGQEAEGPHCA